MPVPRRRHCKSRRDKGRTHKKLTMPTVTVCAKCGEPKAPHRVCPNCGEYKGVTYKVTVSK